MRCQSDTIIYFGEKEENINKGYNSTLELFSLGHLSELITVKAKRKVFKSNGCVWF